MECKPAQGLGTPVQTSDQSAQGEHAKLATKYANLLFKYLSFQEASLEYASQQFASLGVANIGQGIISKMQEAIIPRLMKHLSVEELEQELKHYNNNPIRFKLQQVWLASAADIQRIGQQGMAESMGLGRRILRDQSMYDPNEVHRIRSIGIETLTQFEQVINDDVDEAGDDDQAASTDNGPTPPAANPSADALGDCVIS